MTHQQTMFWNKRSLIAVLGGAGLLVAISLGVRYRLASSVATPQLMRRAVAAIEAHDNSAAAKLLDEILQREPVHYKALLYRGQVARDLGDNQAADRWWSMIPDDHPQEAGVARCLEGLSALSRHQAREAERLFRRSTELHPAYLFPHERLAHLYLLQLRDRELRHELAAIRTARPWSISELLASVGSMGKIHPISVRTAELEDFVAADGDDLNSTLALAECYLADDHPELAEGLLERALASHPGAPAIRGRLAEIFVKQNELDRARDVLGSDAIPHEAPAAFWRGRGAYLAAIGDWNGAVRDFERAAASDGDHIPSAYGYGLALERVGRHDEAGRIHKRVRLMEQVVIQEWRIESAAARNAAFTFPIAVEIARLLLELGRPSDATAWLDHALELNPEDGPARALYTRALDAARSAPVADAAPQVAPVPVHDAATAGPAAPARGPRQGLAGDVSGGQAPPLLNLVDRHDRAAVEFQYQNGAGGAKFLLETLGGGVAAFDYDGDGWPDLYFTQGRPLPVATDSGEIPPDKLFQNRSGTFRDVTEAAGLGDTQYSQGCSAGDFDNDGFPDLAVANFGTNVLYHNNGDGTFDDITVPAGITGQHWNSSLAFADLDRDGNLDLYVVTYVLEPYRICRPSPERIATCSPLNFEAEQDQLFRSRGDGTFEDVTASAGILAEDGKGLGIIVADFDEDGWPDVYVANDGTPNFLFHNETVAPGASLHFAERGLVSGAGVSGTGNSQAGMGVACGDFDGDGLLDLFVTNFYRESATLYRNHGGLQFADVTHAARLDEPTQMRLGFGTQAADFDLDGRLDLFVANGHIDDFSFRGEPWKMAPQLFYNQGKATFVDASRESGEYFNGEYLGRGVVRLDWNRDGRPDLAVVHQDRPAALLANETEQTGHRLIIDLHGVASNRDGVGARITVTSAGVTRVHEICGGDGFFASNERRIIFGLGGATAIERLEVRWPAGQTDEWFDLPADSAVVLIENRPPCIHSLAHHP